MSSGLPPNAYITPVTLTGLGAGGGGGNPCTDTAQSVQYDNGGAFGCTSLIYGGTSGMYAGTFYSTNTLKIWTEGEDGIELCTDPTIDSSRCPPSGQQGAITLNAGIDLNLDANSNIGIRSQNGDIDINSAAGQLRLEAFDTIWLDSTLQYGLGTYPITTTPYDVGANCLVTCLFDATGGAITANLFAATTINSAGVTYTFIKSDASGNAVTIVPHGAETINGAGTYVLSSQYQSVTLQAIEDVGGGFTGGWYVVANGPSGGGGGSIADTTLVLKGDGAGNAIASTISNPPCSGCAGGIGLGQGTLPPNATTSVTLFAPSLVTSYRIELPGAEPTTGPESLIACTDADPAVCAWTAGGTTNGTHWAFGSGSSIDNGPTQFWDANPTSVRVVEGVTESFTGSSANTVNGIYVHVANTATDTNVSTYPYGAWFQADANGNNWISGGVTNGGAIGFTGIGNNNGTGSGASATAAIIGGEIDAINSSTGELLAADGYFAECDNLSSGTIDACISAIGFTANLGTGTITDAAEFDAWTPVNPGGGTITKVTGLRIEDLSGTGIGTHWAIDQQGATDPNRFAGPVDLLSLSDGCLFTSSHVITSTGSACGAGGGSSVVASAEVVSFSATPTFSTSTNVSRIVLTNNITSFTLGSTTDGQDKTLCFKQGAGPYTVAAPAGVHGFFTIGTVSGGWNCQNFVYDNTDSIWLAAGTGEINQ